LTEEFWFECQQTSSGVQPASYNVRTGNTFPGVKATQSWSWQFASISCGD